VGMGQFPAEVSPSSADRQLNNSAVRSACGCSHIRNVGLTSSADLCVCAKDLFVEAMAATVKRAAHGYEPTREAAMAA
jgi:hypothetical protein